MWPFLKFLTTPKMARLSLSVPPLVKIISLARAPRILAMSSLAVSTAFLAITPSLYKAFGLPKFSVQYSSIAFLTRLSIGAAAAWSIYIRFVLIFFIFLFPQSFFQHFLQNFGISSAFRELH